jgi:hypothetical protein
MSFNRRRCKKTLLSDPQESQDYGTRARLFGLPHVITHVERPFVKERSHMQAPDNFTYVIPMNDEIVHTPDSPFCFLDPTCPCHEDQELIAHVAQQVAEGLLTCEEATQTVAGKIL